MVVTVGTSLFRAQFETVLNSEWASATQDASCSGVILTRRSAVKIGIFVGRFLLFFLGTIQDYSV